MNKLDKEELLKRLDKIERSISDLTKMVMTYTIYASFLLAISAIAIYYK